jgi:hypothetical protein
VLVWPLARLMIRRLAGRVSEQLEAFVLTEQGILES